MGDAKQFLIDKRVEMFWCPRLRCVMLRIGCGRRHVHRTYTRWFGEMTEALTTPQDRFCQTCPLGAIHAKRYGLRVKRPKRKQVRKGRAGTRCRKVKRRK